MSRRRLHLCLLACLALCGCLGLAGGARAAHVSHAPEGSFDGTGAPSGPFQYVFGVETDNSGGPGDGDVYVADVREEGERLTTVIEKFDEEGAYAGVSIDGSDSPQGSISFVDTSAFVFATDGIAVDDAVGPNRGDVYVADLGHHVVDRYDESGHYLCQITGTATPSTSECNGLGGSLTPAGGFTPTGLAVDASTGTLYVADFDHNVIDKFSSSGAYIGQISDPHVQGPSGVSLDSTGAIYVLNGNLFFREEGVKLHPDGTFDRELSSEPVFGLGLDPGNDDVYLAKGGFENRRIDVTDPAGNTLATFVPTTEEIYLSLAVSAATGRLYAGGLDFNGIHSTVDLFSPDTIVPDVSTEAPTAVAETTATLHAKVTPDPGGGEVVSCRFEYGPTSSYHQSAPCSPPPPYASPTAVSADVSGLSPSTTYHYRVAAANAAVPPYSRGVPAHSEDTSFSTIGPPTIEEESSGEIERTFASLGAKIDPHGFETEFRFEYVDAADFAKQGGFAGPATRSTPFSQLGAALKPLSVSQGIAGLELDTTYHYRAVAVNERGKGVGPDQTFRTRPVAAIEAQWAYAHLEDARVEARINPLGFDTTCVVQYVADSTFQSSGYADARTVPCLAGLGAGGKDVTARADLEGLQFDAKYHFRFVTTNKSGTAAGEDETFSTFGIDSFSVEVVDENGQPYTQAGGHPYEKIIHYGFNHTFVPTAFGSAGSLDAFIRDVITEQPPGQSSVREEPTKKCPGYKAEEQSCGQESRVGTLTIEYLDGAGVETTTKPLYDIVPPRGVASRYATTGPYTASDTSVRTGDDYGVTTKGLNISEEARTVGLTIVIWGIPAEHVPKGNPSAILRNPTSCTGPQTARVRVDTWEEPGLFATASTQLPAVTGCDRLEFHPGFRWQPTSTVADSPSGLHVDIHQDQSTAPHALAFADLKDVAIDPGAGLVFNPAGAAGLVGCSSAQFGFHRETPADCPEAAKIGTVEIDTPLVDHPLLGGIYLATPHDNPFDSMFAIYLAVSDGKSGVVIKLAGKIRADSGNGQLTADFSENPPLPVEDFKLDFFGGPQSVLRTPLECGHYVTGSTLTPWSAPQSGPPVHASDSYEISSAPGGGDCAASEAEAPFKPEFRAGVLSPKAGAHSPFVIRLHRDDGSQPIARLSVEPPPGLLGHLAGLPRCPDAAIAAAAARSGTEEQAAPSCPAGSAVGDVVVGAGAGPAPYHVDGKVYLGGPYKGAPLSLAVIVPVVAGPFDLGTVAVRTPLRIDLESGRVGVKTDAIPTILEGVPLEIRTIEVKLNRPGFTVNPTNCGATATNATVESPAGRSLQLSAPFQVEGCRRLPFAPRVGLRLLGKSARRAHPALRAELTMPEGGANVASVGVSMPPTQFLDSGNIQGICTREQFEREACPANSVYGYARAWSPLLDQPIGGPVYMRSSSSGLPDLVADLNGEFRIALVGRISSRRRSIGAQIAGLPDVPVSKFVMTIFGGPKGLLQNSVDVCAHRGRGRIEMKGQNGKTAVLRPLLRARCR